MSIVLDCPPGDGGRRCVHHRTTRHRRCCSSWAPVATSREAAQVAIDRLASVQAQVVGVVLNKAKVDPRSEYGYPAYLSNEDYETCDLCSCRSEACGRARMKILITGNLGYVGPWVTRQLRARYPDAALIGLDIGYFAHCLTGACRVPEALLDAQYYADIRRFPAECACRRRRGGAPGRDFERSDGQRLRGCDPRRELPRGNRAGASGEGRWCPLVRLCLELQRVRLGGRPTPNRAVRGQPTDRLCEVQGAHRAGVARAGRLPTSGCPACGSRPRVG